MFLTPQDFWILTYIAMESKNFARYTVRTLVGCPYSRYYNLE